MIAIQYNGEFLQLAGGEQPVIRVASTAFNDDDKLEGSGSLPLALANSAKNNQLLEFSTHLANRLARQDIEVMVYLMGRPYKRCTYTYNLQNGRPDGHLRIDIGELAAQLKNVELPQVFVQITDGIFVDHEWVSLGSDPAQVANSIAVSHTPQAAPYTFFPYINEALFGDYSGEGAPLYTQPRIINRWNDGELMWRVSDVPVGSEGAFWFTPFLYFTWVLKKVCRFMGYEAVGDIFENDFINSLVIDNNTVYNWEDVFINAPDGWSFAPARHLPAIKLNEFIKKIRNHFKVIPYFNSDTRQAHFMLADGVLNSTDRVALDGYVEKGKTNATKTEETGFELVQAVDSNDSLFEILPYTKSFFIGETTVPKRVELPIATTFMLREANADQSGTPLWRLPYKEQLGNAYGDRAEGSAAHNPEDYGRNQWAFRLISYQGLRQDAAGNSYPYATSDGLDTDGVTELCDSCWLGGDRGILELFQKTWCIFLLRAEKVELRLRLTDRLINQLSPLKKVWWATDEDVHLEGLFSMLEFTADSRKQLLPGELTVYPFYNQAAADLPGYSRFTGGSVENEDTTFVRMTVVEVDRDYKKRFLAGKYLRRITSKVTFYFFSDLEALVPKDVVNLKVNYNVHTVDFFNGTYDTPVSVVANGTSFVAGYYTTFYDNRDDSYYNKTLSIKQGDYVIIP